MTDQFALLAQPRRPWLEEEILKQAFHHAMAQQHPDVTGGSGEASAALNAAYAVLREPAPRLRHLLELENAAGSPAPPGIAPELADLFGKIAGLRQRGAMLAKKLAAAQSPLAQALLVGERGDYRKELEGARADVEAGVLAAHAELKALDAIWDERDPTALRSLGELQRRFAFLAKWEAQLREDLFRLGE